ncbi:MAG: transcriptional regulator [Ruminococcaceae bacterium]|nr:transcriptional regulator [Oscillospiraceae bacterium]
MAARSGQKLKLLYIADILKKYTDEDNPISATEICEKLIKLGVTAERKAIYNDIDNLCFYGYDIVHTRTPKNGYFLASREFELPEIYLLCDAIRSAPFISAKKSRELISKLDAMLSVNQVKKREKGIYINEKSKTANEEIYYNIDSISQAIEQKKKITFKYGTRHLEEGKKIVTVYKEMTVSPYALVWQDDYYYLIGNYSKYDNLIHLRVDRIRKVNITDEPMRHYSEVSDYTDFFDIGDYTSRLFGMFGGDLETVELTCKKEMLEQVADRFGDGVFIKNVTDTTFDLSVEVVISEALVTWISNYGDKIKVNSPISLQNMLCDRANRILKMYK